MHFIKQKHLAGILTLVRHQLSIFSDDIDYWNTNSGTIKQFELSLVMIPVSRHTKGRLIAFRSFENHNNQICPFSDLQCG